MKFVVLSLLAGVLLLQSGCALPPSIDQQSREESQQQQVEKRSDAFAKQLNP
jgi:starvation-inducible outer membrane lipoprotein